MRITDRQKQLLDSLTCERLSSNEAHLRMVDSFFNGRNGSLEHTLKNEAYAEDEEGNIAFYLVKDADNRILFYFSVKCGMLYVTPIMPSQAQQVCTPWSSVLKPYSVTGRNDYFQYKTTYTYQYHCYQHNNVHDNIK